MAMIRILTGPNFNPLGKRAVRAGFGTHGDLRELRPMVDLVNGASR